MKLLRENGRLYLFETSDDIVIDNSLPKYSRLMKNKSSVSLKEFSDMEAEKLKLENERFDQMVSGVGEDPDRFTVDDYKFLEDFSKKKILEQIKDMKSIKEVIGDKDADKFNIRISSRLLKLMKDHSPNSLNLRILSEPVPTRIYGDGNSESEEKEKSTFKRIWNWLFGRKNKDEEDKRVYELSVIDLFNEVKIISGKEREFKDRLENYMSLLNKSLYMNQTSQTEALISSISVHVYESILAASGFNHYITFYDLETLQRKCKRQLDMDYVKNFVKVIPDEVVEKKIIADNLKVFDNYVVLYYDPSGKAFKMTEEEKKIKKDPILFGVIYGSPKLYYIADWVDEFCDLTWEQVVEKLKEDKTL